MKRILGVFTALCIFLSVLTPLAWTEEAPSAQSELYATMDAGIGSAEAYIDASLESLYGSGDVGYGIEWFILAMLRGGKTVDTAILDAYYASVVTTVKTWTAETKPTDIERTALALCAMGKDITDVDGVNVAALIYNSPRLSEGANELAYALLALEAAKIDIPDTAVWSKAAIAERLLTFQTTEGSFGLYGAENGDADITAICLQALTPYRADAAITQAVESGLTFLKAAISDNLTYADNVNTTAQVLLALSVLRIDVTDEENGFGNAESNIIYALEQYRNPEGDGYVFGGNVNAMATVQVMQAYDAYKKAHLEQISYWDFPQISTDEGEIPTPPPTEPEQPGEEPEPPVIVEPATPQNVYVTIASEGRVVEDKNGGHVARALVSVEDYNCDGYLSVDEALYAAHEAYYPGGAAAGYGSYRGTYGLALAILWGKGSAGTSAAAGYWKNNTSCMSLDDAVSASDSIVAFNYYDAVTWADSYAYFMQDSATVEAGKAVELTLMHLSGYDAENNYAQIFSGCAGAKLMLLGTDTEFAQTTDAEGKVSLAVSAAMTPGEYTLVAYKEDNSIVPAVCKLTIRAKRPSSSGGGITAIKVYIRVADPAGETYLPKKSYSVSRGTTVYALLKKTGLEIETSTSLYGLYVSAIEGLSEFDMGSGSGWMYRVNGDFVQTAIDVHKLSSGDYVEVLYTRDYGEDLKEAAKPSGSSGTKPPKTYQITFASNGGSGVESQSVQKNKLATEPAAPEKAGFVFDGWYTDSTLTKPYDFSAKVTDDVVLYAKWTAEEASKNEFTEATYPDVAEDAWYYEAVRYAYENDLMQGTENGFEPENSLTRAMLVTVLWRLDGEKTAEGAIAFADVEEDAWYADAVRWAVQAQLVFGKEVQQFGTNDFITREQFVTILYRYFAGRKAEAQSGNTMDDFKDVAQISDYATEAMAWAVENGILQGREDAYLAPDSTLTRAEAAAIFMRLQAK